MSKSVAFLASGLVAPWLRATPGGDQMEAMFGDFSLGGNIYAAIALIAAASRSSPALSRG